MRLTYEDKASIKLDRQQKNINPVDYAVWGALQQDVLQSSDRGFGGSQRQSAYLLGQSRPTSSQLINKAIDLWRQTLKTIVKVYEGTLNSCLLDCMSCNCYMKFSLFYLNIHASTHFQLCFTIVIQYSLGALILWYYLLIYVKKTYQFKIHCKDDVLISLH